jgi:hypothetical protein
VNSLSYASIIEMETTEREANVDEHCSSGSIPTTLETAKDGILILDADTGQIMDVNPS